MKKKKIRNPVAKNAKSSGARVHKDKNKNPPYNGDGDHNTQEEDRRFGQPHYGDDAIYETIYWDD